MVDAIQSSGGGPGVDVTLCSSLQNQNPSLNVQIAGVSLISNIYHDGSLTVTVWKAFWIGPGKCIWLSELTTPQVLQVLDFVKCVGDTAEEMPNAHFIKVNSRSQPCSIWTLILRDVQILRRSLWPVPRILLFFLSGGRICENISSILHLKSLSRSWKTRVN